jgi:hypothetical protein
VVEVDVGVEEVGSEAEEDMASKVRTRTVEDTEDEVVGEYNMMDTAIIVEVVTVVEEVEVVKEGSGVVDQIGVWHLPRLLLIKWMGQEVNQTEEGNERHQILYMTTRT